MNAHSGQNVKADGAKLFQLSQFGYTALQFIFVNNKLDESRTKHIFRFTCLMTRRIPPGFSEKKASQRTVHLTPNLPNTSEVQTTILNVQFFHRQ
jgi:hypothetical protein